jgi:chromosome segregation ATPase
MMSDKKLLDKLEKVNQLTEKKKYLEQKRTNRDFVDQNSDRNKEVILSDDKNLKSTYQYESLKGKFVLGLKNIKSNREDKKTQKNLKKLNKLNDKINQLNTDLSEVDNTIIEKVTEIELQQRELSVCHVQIKELETKIVASKKEIKLKVDAYNLNELEINEYEKNKADLRANLEATQSELGRKKKGNEWQGELLTELANEKDKLNENIASLKDQISVLIREEAEVSQNIELLRNQVRELNSIKEEVIEEYNVVMVEVNEVKVQFTKIEKDLDSTNNFINEKSEELEHKKKTKSELHIRISTLQSEINSKKTVSSSLSVSLDEIDLEIEERKIELSSLEIEYRDEDYIHNEILDKTERLRKSLQNFTEEKNVLKSKYDVLHEEIKTSETYVKELNLELEQCQLEVIRLEHMVDDEEVISKKLSQDLSQKTEELESLKSKVKSNQSKCYDLGVGNRELNNTISLLNEKNVGHLNQLESLDDKYDVLLLDEKQSVEKRNEFQRSISELEEKIGTRKNEVVVLSKKIEALECENKINKEKVYDLKLVLSSESRLFEAQAAEHSNSLEEKNAFVGDIDEIKANIIAEQEKITLLNLKEKSLKATIQNIKKEVHTLEESLTLKVIEKDEHLRKVNDVTSTKEKWIFKKSELARSYANVLKEIESSKGILSDQSNVLSNVQEVVKDLVNDTKVAERENQSLRNTINTCLQNIQKTEKHMADVQQKHDLMLKEKITLEEKVARTKSTLITLNNSKEEKSLENIQLSNDIKELKENVKQYCLEEKGLSERKQTQNRNNTKISEEKSIMSNQLIRLKNSIETSNTELLLLNKKHDQLRSEMRSYQGELTKGQNKFQELDLSKKTIITECQRLDTKLAALKEKKINASAKDVMVEKDLNQLKHDCHSLKLLNNAIVLEINELEERTKQASASTFTLSQDKESLESKLKLAVQKRDKTQEDLKNRESRIANLKNDIIFNKKKVNTITPNLNILESKNSTSQTELIKCNKENESIIDRLKGIEEKILKQEEESVQAEKNITEMKCQSEKMTTQFQQKTQRSHEYDQKIERMRSEIEKQYIFNESIKRKVSKVNVVSKDELISELADELNQAKLRQDILQEKLEAKRLEKANSIGKINEMKTTVHGKLEQIKSQEKTIQSLNLELARLSSESKQLYRDNAGATKKISTLDKREKLLTKSVEKRFDSVGKTKEKLKNTREIDILMATKTGNQEYIFDKIMEEDETPPELPMPNNEDVSNENTIEVKKSHNVRRTQNKV